MAKQNPLIDEFIDKCTARWLFEKTGVQLYEQALKKCPANLKPKLQEIRDQEKQHEEMLEDVIRKHGGDPHSMTPAARITKTESMGIVEVVENEDFKAIVDALLGAELIDTANWEFLAMLAEKVGDKEAGKLFEKALSEESEHLRFIRGQIVDTLRRSPAAA